MTVGKCIEALEYIFFVKQNNNLFLQIDSVV